MLSSLLQAFQSNLRRAAQRAAIGAVALIFCMTGVFFLTLAAWIALAAALGTLSAALILGLVFMGVGLLAFALVAMRRTSVPHRSVPPAPPPPPPPVRQTDLINAFLAGLDAAKSMRRR
jgi:vacuolar-type H+-ATPase subunit I/STV1